MLKTRIYTAAILVPVVILGIFMLPSTKFAIASAIVLLFAAWEWSNLAGLTNYVWRVGYLVVMACALSIAYLVPLDVIFTLAMVWWVLAAIMVLVYPKGSELWANNVMIKSVFGLFMIVPCWVGLNMLHYEDVGPGFLLYGLLIIWFMDAGAYMSGKIWGKRKLLPKVSPGKTVEGLLGGFAMVILLALGSVWFLPIAMILPWLIITLIAAIFSVLGDLTESMFKRQMKIKDSGWILPGHGGVLDRLDSMLAAIPVFALGIKIIL